MEKIIIALLISSVALPVFAASKNIKQTSGNSAGKIYPMDSFDPNKFSVSNIPEFTKRYFSEAEIFLKKGEFETTAEYEERLAQGFKLKSLDSNKIYAFELDSTKIDYDIDTAQYKIKTAEIGSGRILARGIYSDEQNFLRIGKIHRKMGSYIGENGYGVKVKIQEIKGEDFYIKASSNLKYIKEDVIIPVLTFPVSVETAKKYATCSKKLYVFAQLNNTKPNLRLDVVSEAITPTRSLPLSIFVTGKTIPMDIMGMVLKCTSGQIIATTENTGSTSKGIPFERGTLSKPSSH